jgi:hypothetical protein
VIVISRVDREIFMAAPPKVATAEMLDCSDALCEVW